MDNPNAYRLIGRNYSDANLAAIQKYLEAGGDPNYQLYSGVTVFHQAVFFLSDNIEVIRELINAGADVNLSTHLGFTPLHYAVAYRKRRVVDALIQSGASVNAKDFLGRTILHRAVYKFTYEEQFIKIQFDPDIRIINKLLKHESMDCNLMDANGETPLIVAVKDQQFATVVKLLNNGANPNICNNASETPLHAAFSLPQNMMEIELLLRGASIYAIDKNEQTPVDILIKNGLCNRTNVWVMLILKIIAFYYSVTSDLKRKFEHFPHLLHFLNRCCGQVDHMSRDFISGRITVHDFLRTCVAQNDFRFLLLQIHKPIVERLSKGFYSDYLIHILRGIPKFSLISILQMAACSNRRKKAKGKVKDIADLFSILDVCYLFSNHLSHVEIFCLIRALSENTAFE